jgi:hypothetical protein
LRVEALICVQCPYIPKLAPSLAIEVSMSLDAVME